MKCLTRVKSNVYAPTSTDLISQNMIYWQMSKHYQRVKSAKKVVDTSAPFPSKYMNASKRRGKKASSECQSPVSSRSSFKIGSHGFSQRSASSVLTCTEEHRLHSIAVRDQRAEMQVSNPKCRRISKNSKHHIQHATNQHCNVECYHESATKSRTCAKTLERSLANLHKKVADQTSTQTSAYSADSDSQSNWNADQEVQFLPHYTLHKGKVASELSSCDSAYNGGISSGGESRGSTPEQNQTHVHNTDIQTDEENDATSCNKNGNEMSDAYLQFTNEIINTIIKNNTLSNNGIRNIIKLYMSEYEGKLDKIKMIQEVKKLLVQLDVEDEDKPELKILESDEPYGLLFTNKNNKNTTSAECNVLRNNITGNGCSVGTEVSDPFDDDLLLQEYRSELKKLNIDPENFMFPSSGGVELTVEYMCTYPFTENGTSQDIFEEELWLHPYKVDVPLDVARKCNGMESDAEDSQNLNGNHFSSTSPCSVDISNTSYNTNNNMPLLQTNLDFQLQHTAQLNDQHSHHQASIDGDSECSQISCLSEMFIDCKLNDA